MVEFSPEDKKAQRLLDLQANAIRNHDDKLLEALNQGLRDYISANAEQQMDTKSDADEVVVPEVNATSALEAALIAQRQAMQTGHNLAHANEVVEDAMHRLQDERSSEG